MLVRVDWYLDVLVQDGVKVPGEPVAQWVALDRERQSLKLAILIATGRRRLRMRIGEDGLDIFILINILNLKKNLNQPAITYLLCMRTT